MLDIITGWKGAIGTKLIDVMLAQIKLWFKVSQKFNIFKVSQKFNIFLHWEFLSCWKSVPQAFWWSHTVLWPMYQDHTMISGKSQ